jgi:hypothetical protein
MVTNPQVVYDYLKQDMILLKSKTSLLFNITTRFVQCNQKFSVHLMIITKNTQKYFKQFQLPSQNTFGMCNLLYWTRSSRTQFGVSINVWRLAGDSLNITCNFPYCNHQVYRDFLITLYIHLYIHSASRWLNIAGTCGRGFFSKMCFGPCCFGILRSVVW